MSFPVYRRPGAVVFLDDDLDYLEMMADVMPADWYVQLFVSPLACITLLTNEAEAIELDAWSQQEIINQWRAGGPLIPQILQYWRVAGTARFAFAKVCVVDYSMPAMNGLSALSELIDWPGSSILLTGRADEQIAVSAFNRGLIQQFIPKQSPDIRLRLSDGINSLLQKPDTRYEQTWRATLSREQSALLGDTAVAIALEKLAVAQGWIEHIVIGEPFGVLALDGNARAFWLQLEPPDRLNELAEIAESQHWPNDAVQQVRAGQKLIDLELQLALGNSQKPRLQDAFGMGNGPAVLHAALFDIDRVFCPHIADSHQQFIAGRRQRLLPS